MVDSLAKLVLMDDGKDWKGYWKADRRRSLEAKTDYDMKEIGERIRKLRERNGISRALLAERMDCSPDTLGRIERGEREIRSDYLWMISVEFSVTVDYIMKGDLPELSVDNELAGLIRGTNRRKRCAVLELARAFHWGEEDA